MVPHWVASESGSQSTLAAYKSLTHVERTSDKNVCHYSEPRVRAHVFYVHGAKLAEDGFPMRHLQSREKMLEDLFRRILLASICSNAPATGSPSWTVPPISV